MYVAFGHNDIQIYHLKMDAAVSPEVYYQYLSTRLCNFTLQRNVFLTLTARISQINNLIRFYNSRPMLRLF